MVATQNKEVASASLKATRLEGHAKQAKWAWASNTGIARGGHAVHQTPAERGQGRESRQGGGAKLPPTPAPGTPGASMMTTPFPRILCSQYKIKWTLFWTNQLVLDIIHIACVISSLAKLKKKTASRYYDLLACLRRLLHDDILRW